MTRKPAQSALKKHSLSPRQIELLKTLRLIGGSAFRDDGGPRSREYKALAEQGLVCIDYIPLGEVRLSQAGLSVCDATWGNPSPKPNESRQNKGT